MATRSPTALPGKLTRRAGHVCDSFQLGLWAPRRPERDEGEGGERNEYDDDDADEDTDDDDDAVYLCSVKMFIIMIMVQLCCAVRAGGLVRNAAAG